MCTGCGCSAGANPRTTASDNKRVSSDQGSVGKATGKGKQLCAEMQLMVALAPMKHQ